MRDGLDVDPDSSDRQKLLLPFKAALLRELPRHRAHRTYALRRGSRTAVALLEALGMNDARGPALSSPVRRRGPLLRVHGPRAIAAGSRPAPLNKSAHYSVAEGQLGQF
jgi:hypothetical protein